MNDTATSLREQYETSVMQLREEVARLRRVGCSNETIARVVHEQRLRLSREFKERTPEPLRSRIFARTIVTYGNPVGPTIEFLRARGRSWEDVIDGATRPGWRPV